MRSKNAFQIAVISAAWIALLITGAGVRALDEPLCNGAQGPGVYEAQNCLYLLGYLTIAPDGRYGATTAQAVIRFQAEHGLQADGVIGPMTWAALQEAGAKAVNAPYVVRPGDTIESLARRFSTSPEAIADANHLVSRSLASGQALVIPPVKTNAARGMIRVELAAWEEATILYGDFAIARIIDIRTGRSFLVRRRGGHFHADSEPLTRNDTQTMQQILGGKWSWDRRPVVVEVKGRWLAASMNGMPHGGERISDNGFSGHFCLHFLGSKLHNSGLADPIHQKMVMEAALFGR